MKLSVKVGIGTSSYTTEVYENDLLGFVCELLEKHDKISIAIGINYCDFNKDYSKSAISEKLQKFAFNKDNNDFVIAAALANHLIKEADPVS